MQAKVISSNFNEASGATVIKLNTPYGIFKGIAHFNKEAEKFNPSRYVGTEIAESRAYIAAYNEALKRKREQLKGIKRLLNSCGNNPFVFKYANKISKSINMEIADLIDEKRYHKQRISNAIAARSLYTRSRSVDKKAKKEYLERIGEAIKTLGQITSKNKE